MLDGRLAQFVGDFNQIPAIPGQAIIENLNVAVEHVNSWAHIK
jgi:hypothetical protein